MKKIILFWFLAISTHGFSQQTAKREKKLSPKDTLIRDTIIFDGLTGIPNKNRVYVPFNSWVAITVKNVNPFKSVPKTELIFTNMDFGKTNDIPSLLDLVKSPAEDKPIDKPDADKTKKTEATKDKFDATLEKSLDRLSFLNESLSELSNSEKNLTEAEIKKRKEAEKKLKLDIKKLEDSINALKTNIMLLTKVIEKMMLDQENEKKFRDAYESFISSINDISGLLTLNVSFSQLFKEQFISKSYTDKTIKELLKSRLPNYNQGDEKIVLKANEFLKSRLSKLLINHGDASLAYQKINTPSDTDSYKGSGSIKLNNSAEIKIGNLELKVIREAKYKEQMAFMNSKIFIAKNDSIKQSILVYSDTLMARIERVLNDPFEQTLKSFRANADEIKVTVPLSNVEPFTVNTTGRLRVDVSTSLFAHFGKSDDKFKTVKDTSNQTYIIKQRSEGANFAIGFLINAYVFEPRSKINVGGSLGLNFPVNGSSTNNTSNIQLVGGLSFFTTSIDRLSVTMGASLRKGQRLNTNNLLTTNNGDTYNFKNKNDVDAIYDPVYRVGGFLGISYSLFTNKSKESK